MIALLGALALK
ncbi:hypothetical protein VCEC0009_000236A, partial [Vibrio cholerae O1 str. EC-0009]